VDALTLSRRAAAPQGSKASTGIAMHACLHARPPALSRCLHARRSRAAEDKAARPLHAASIAPALLSAELAPPVPQAQPPQAAPPRPLQPSDHATHHQACPEAGCRVFPTLLGVEV